MTKARPSRLQRSRPILIAVLAVACCLGAAIPIARMPSVSEQLAAKPAGLIVSLTQPSDGSQWQIFSTITISAEAAGSQRIQSLELWVDGNLLHKVSTASGRASWTWTMEGLYQRTLWVRARDDQGRAYNSNVVRVTGIMNPHPGFDMMYTAKDGDTVASVAATFGVKPEEITSANGPGDVNAPIPAGKNLKVPFVLPPIPAPPGSPSSSPQQDPSAQTQPPSPNQPSKYAFWVSQFLQPTPPAAPDLALTASGCSLNALITDRSSNELGFNVYRLDPNAQGFKKIASLGANGNATTPIQYVDPSLYGAFSYYVTAINAAGETASNTATANVAGADCLTPFWSGSQAAGAASTEPVSEQPAFPKPTKYDKTYYYISINNGPRQRVPADRGQFLSLPAGIFDVSAQMKALISTKGSGPFTVDFDAWGWKGGSLIHIGDFKDVILPQPNAPIISIPGLLQVCADPPCFQGADVGGSFVNDAIGNEFKSWQFRWLANSPDVTAGLVQVSILPFEKTCGPNPSGLVWSGSIPASKPYFTVFNVDLVPLHTKPVKVGGWTISDNVGFYIRVVPQINGQTFCQPSNTATWVYKVFVPPTAKPTPKPLAMTDPYVVLISSVTPYQFADPSTAGCVQVTKNDYYQPLPAGQDYITWVQNYQAPLFETLSITSSSSPAQKADAMAKIMLAYWIPVGPGAGLCPPPPPPPPSEGNAWDQFVTLAKGTVKGLEDGFNAAVHGYDAAKTWLVENVASVIPICNDPDNKEDCEKALGAGLDVGLAAIGLPPNLPSTQDVLKAAEGDIADLAVSEMGDYCPNKAACKAAVQAGLDLMIAKNAQDQSNSFCQSAGICIPPQYATGIVTQPWPTASVVPSIASVQVIRRPDVPASALPPFSCALSLESTAMNDSWIGQAGIPLGTYNEVFWTGDHIEGQLFKDAFVGIPDGMAPGESVTLPVFLSPHSNSYPNWSFKDGFWIHPHGDWDNANLPYFDPDPDDWHLLYQGSNATFTAHMTCFSQVGGFPDFKYSVYPNLNNIFKNKLDVTFPK